MNLRYLNKTCPICGGFVVLLDSGIEMCEKCHYTLPSHYNLPSSVQSQMLDSTRYSSTAVGKAIGSVEPQTLTITNCEKFKVQLRELDVEFELEPDKLENIDTLIINGYKYVKEK
jgi:ribosomal protein S27AE